MTAEPSAVYVSRCPVFVVVSATLSTVRRVIAGFHGKRREEPSDHHKPSHVVALWTVVD